MNKIDDKLKLVEAFEVGQLGRITGADKCFKSGADERARSAAKYGLLAKQVCFRLFAESRFDNAGASAADALCPSQGYPFSGSARVLMNRDQSRDAAAFSKFPTHHRSQAFRRDHYNINIYSWNKRAVMNRKAVRDKQRLAWPHMGCDFFFISLRHFRSGQREKNDICPTHSLGRIDNFKAGAPRRDARFAFAIQPNDDGDP